MAEFKFDEATHTYTLDGVTLPSVTEICKPLSVDIAENARPWLRDAAAKRGTLVHEYCTEIDYTNDYSDVSVPRDIAGYISAYIKFLRDYRIRSWMAVERKLYAPIAGFAGTLDRAGRIDGVTTIVDIKTGTKIDKAMLTAQLNGYKYLWQGTVEDEPVNLMGLQLNKDGSYRVYPCEASFIFIQLLSIHEERKRLNASRKRTNHL